MVSCSVVIVVRALYASASDSALGFDSGRLGSFGRKVDGFPNQGAGSDAGRRIEGVAAVDAAAVAVHLVRAAGDPGVEDPLSLATQTEVPHQR